MLYNHSGVQPFAGGLVLHPNQHLRAVFDVGGQLVDGAVGVAGDSGIQDASLLISDVTVRFVAQLAGPTAVDLMTVPTSHASATSTPNPIKMQRQSETRGGVNPGFSMRSRAGLPVRPGADHLDCQLRVGAEHIDPWAHT